MEKFLIKLFKTYLIFGVILRASVLSGHKRMTFTNLIKTVGSCNQILAYVTGKLAVIS